MGENAEARQALAMACRLNPEYTWAFVEMSAALRALGRYEEAVQALDNAIEKDPGNSRYWAERGEVLGVFRKFFG